jgi:hypothetical protein
MKSPQEVASHIVAIAENSAELFLIKAKVVERWPQRSVYLTQQIEHSEAVITEWLRLAAKQKAADE